AGGNQELSSCVVKLEKGDETHVEAAYGRGPIDACYRAIDNITGVSGRLIDYTVGSVTRGKDALGEVFVHVQINGKNYTGKAASVDIIDASVRAYLNAVNKALHELRRLEEKEVKDDSSSADQMVG